MNTASEAEIVYNGTNHAYSVIARHAPHPKHALRNVTNIADLLQHVLFSEFSRNNFLYCSIIHVTYNDNDNNNNNSRILLYVFFWVIPRLLNFICRRFGTLCSIFTGK
jgi:hypothetical protein